MANLGIPYDPPSNPKDRVTSYVDSQSNILLIPQVATGAKTLDPDGPQNAYFMVIPTSITKQNEVESGWNHFCFKPATTVITDDMTENLLLLPGQTGASEGVLAYGVIAPYDSVVTVFASCIVDYPTYPSGSDPDKYDRRTFSNNYLVVGKNYELYRDTGAGYFVTSGYERQVPTIPGGQHVNIPVTTRGIDVSPDCLACTYVEFEADTKPQVMTVYTSALVKKGDVINVSLFVEPPSDEDDYNVQQSVRGFQTQIGFTKAEESETGQTLLQALNPAKPRPRPGFVYGD